jgi:pSer/pThr/pTyr-binding forkhead associated (FHA) protein
MPSLQVVAGAHAGTLIPLVAQSVVLGRNRTCDVVIPMVAVSRNHARIERVGQVYFIEDRLSRNGTFINDQAIRTRTELKDHDRIRICDFIAVYCNEPFGKHLPLEAVPEEWLAGAMFLEPSRRMTEQEWLASVNPIPMLDLMIADSAAEQLGFPRASVEPSRAPVFPSGPVCRRKLRLFICACARRIWHQLGHPANQEGVEVAERYADGEATEDDLDHAREAMRRGSLTESMVGYQACREGSNMERYAAQEAARAVEVVLGGGQQGRRDIERAALAALCRDLVRPFRPVTAEPAWLAWEGGLVSRLACAAYDERCLPGGTLDGARLSVLADALEDAGCTNGELLEHLRGPGVHVRGCWAVDLLMADGRGGPVTGPGVFAKLEGS